MVSQHSKANKLRINTKNITNKQNNFTTFKTNSIFDIITYIWYISGIIMIDCICSIIKWYNSINWYISSSAWYRNIIQWYIIINWCMIYIIIRWISKCIIINKNRCIGICSIIFNWSIIIWWCSSSNLLFNINSIWWCIKLFIWCICWFMFGIIWVKDHSHSNQTNSSLNGIILALTGTFSTASSILISSNLGMLSISFLFLL